MPDFEPVKSGQKIKGRFKASEWNSVRESARQFEQSRTSGKSKQQPGFVSSGIVEVCFTDKQSVGSLEPFQVVILGDPFFDYDDKEYDSRPVFKCSDVGALIANKKFAILLEDAHWREEGSGTIAKAMISGVIQCKIKKKHANHKFARLLASDSTQLESAESGPVEILSMESGSVGSTLNAYVLMQWTSEDSEKYVLLNCKNPFDMSLAKLTSGGSWQRLVEEYKIVSLVGDGINCYKVVAFDPEKHGDLAEECAACYKVEKEYPDCASCKVCWYLVACDPEQVPEFMVTNTDVAEFKTTTAAPKSINITFTWEESPVTGCYKVDSPIECSGHAYGETVEVVVNSSTTVAEGEDPCEACGDTYKLENCQNESDTIETSDDLLAIMFADRDIDEIPGDESIEGQVFHYMGGCYEITEYSAPVADPEDIIKEGEWDWVKFGCTTEIEEDPCGCYELMPCPSGTSIFIKTAKNEDGAPVDLTTAFDDEGNPVEVVILNDGTCGHVKRSLTCVDAVEVVVVEKLTISSANIGDPCEQCKFWTIQKYDPETCETTGSPVTTYTDLGFYGFEVDDFIRITSTKALGEAAVAQDPVACWKIINHTATWSAGIVAVEFEGEPYDTCEKCSGQQVYKISGGCPSITCEGSQEPEYEDKYTTDDLAIFSGRWGKDNGVCVKVTAVDEIPEEEDDQSVSLEGPYPSCRACQNDREPVEVVVGGCVYMDGDKVRQPRYKIKVLSSCKLEDCTIDTEEECEEE